MGEIVENSSRPLSPASEQSQRGDCLGDGFHAQYLYAVGNAKIFKVVLGQDQMVKSKARTFADAPFDLGNRAHLAREAHLPHHRPAAGDGEVAM